MGLIWNDKIARKSSSYFGVMRYISTFTFSRQENLWLLARWHWSRSQKIGSKCFSRRRKRGVVGTGFRRYQGEPGRSRVCRRRAGSTARQSRRRCRPPLAGWNRCCKRVQRPSESIARSNDPYKLGKYRDNMNLIYRHYISKGKRNYSIIRLSDFRHRKSGKVRLESWNEFFCRF